MLLYLRVTKDIAYISLIIISQNNCTCEFCLLFTSLICIFKELGSKHAGIKSSFNFSSKIQRLHIDSTVYVSVAFSIPVCESREPFKQKFYRTEFNGKHTNILWRLHELKFAFKMVNSKNSLE